MKTFESLSFSLFNLTLLYSPTISNYPSIPRHEEMATCIIIIINSAASLRFPLHQLQSFVIILSQMIDVKTQTNTGTCSFLVLT